MADLSKHSVVEIRLTADSSMHKAYEPFGFPLADAAPSVDYEMKMSDGNWKPMKAGERPEPKKDIGLGEKLWRAVERQKEEE